MASGIVLPSVAGVCRLPCSGERLANLLRERRAEPFAWGRFDCCLFAADAIAAQVGTDPAKHLRGRYATELQAARILAVLGGLEGIGRRVLGEPLAAPLLACLGDVGLVRHEGRDILGVNVGEHWRVPAAVGLAVLPLEAARTAWRVGCA